MSPALGLKAQLRRAGRRRRLQAFALVAPLLAFLLFTFAAPIICMLWRSVSDPDVAVVLPHTIEQLRAWDGKDAPDEATFRALAEDLKQAPDGASVAKAARRLNYAISGYRTLLMSARRYDFLSNGGDMKAAFIGRDPRWGEAAYWGALKQAGGPITSFYLLAAVDLQRDSAGSIVNAPEEVAIYRDVLFRTFKVSCIITVICLVLGFPVAFVLANASPHRRNLLFIPILLPFWTSLLVRTMAWILLLQRDGPVNKFLQMLGIIDHPLNLIFNSFAVYVAMIHVLLPYMILPLYSVMQQIKPSYMNAALSLGARPSVAFVRIYMPLALPGIAAGSLLVLILALGYYITPTLVGGAADQMLSYFIAMNTQETSNWGLAAALGVVLLGSTLILYWIYRRLLGGNQISLG
jgi:putative spermidine/putrescine transport system permease protein